MKTLIIHIEEGPNTRWTEDTERLRRKVELLVTAVVHGATTGPEPRVLVSIPGAGDETSTLKL